MAAFVLSAERLAEVFGVNRRTVYEWISHGCPARKIGAEWRLDTAEVFDWVRKRPGKSSGGDDQATELELREQEARTVLAELKTRRELGRVVEIVAVQAAFAHMGRIHALARENTPPQLAPLLVGKSDLTEIEVILRRELRAIDEGVIREIEAQHGELVSTVEGAPDGDAGVADL